MPSSLGIAVCLAGAMGSGTTWTCPLTTCKKIDVPGRQPNVCMTESGNGTLMTPEPISAASLDANIAITPLVDNCKLHAHGGQAIRTVGNQMTNCLWWQCCQAIPADTATALQRYGVSESVLSTGAIDNACFCPAAANAASYCALKPRSRFDQLLLQKHQGERDSEGSWSPG